jgi:hypothetical protein
MFAAQVSPSSFDVCGRHKRRFLSRRVFCIASWLFEARGRAVYHIIGVIRSRRAWRYCGLEEKERAHGQHYGCQESSRGVARELLLSVRDETPLDSLLCLRSAAPYGCNRPLECMANLIGRAHVACQNYRAQDGHFSAFHYKPMRSSTLRGIGDNLNLDNWLERIVPCFEQRLVQTLKDMS